MSEVFGDENSVDSFSDFSQFSITQDDNQRDETKSDLFKNINNNNTTNVTNNLINRQIYGKFVKNPKAKTERIFNNIHPKCKFVLSSLIKDYESMNHIYMGFTLCGQYFISFTEKPIETPLIPFSSKYEYELYLWRFVPGEKLKFVSKHRIFKQQRGIDVLDKILIMQFPMDPHKILCYGLSNCQCNPMVYITILTLPFPKSCKHCPGNMPEDDSVRQGWCVKHGFTLHCTFSMSQPCPNFDPNISLAYPDHLVINTGHYIHILNVATLDPPQNSINNLTNLIKDDEKLTNTQTDTFSEVSETPSEHFGTNSIVDAIIEDFNEYDLEGNDCNKPFHELNISCEPLNVTGKSYHNTLVQNIVDPRFKRLQNSNNNSKDHLFSVPQTSNSLQKTNEKNKIIDKKIAEKAYEFIEENEKCEKLSLFRKKRLAEKKYEFSEDNSENIVPFNSLRRERRYLYRSQNRYSICSPDFNSFHFLSPRSPMQSPNSRNGQFSPGSGVRNLYCPSSTIRNSPHHSKSPISPKESARKFSVYSPSLDSDCSDSDSRLILRMPSNCSTSSSSQHIDSRFTNNNNHQQNGLLIVDPKTETPKWIKKVVRRYSNADFETSSLLSGQSRDDYNIPIEIPLLVQTLSDQHLDVVPDFKVDQVTEMQLIVTQRTFDCDRFVQRRAQILCAESQLEFLHCEDYDIKINYVCPLDGHIVCQAVIKMGTVKDTENNGKLEHYTTHCLFTWNIVNDKFEIIETADNMQLQLTKFYQPMPLIDKPTTNCNSVLVMDYCHSETKTTLRDYNNYYEIDLVKSTWPTLIRPRLLLEETITISSDSD